MEYDFTLKFQLAADDCDLDQIVERLAVAGCDDATVGVGQPGRISLVFAREGSSKRRTKALTKGRLRRPRFPSSG